MYIFGLFYGWKKAWATLKSVSFRGLIQNFRRASARPLNEFYCFKLPSSRMSWYFCWPGFRKSRYLLYDLYDTTCPRGTLVASRRRKIERKSISQGPRFALRLNASLCLACLRDRRKNSNVWPRNIADDPASLVVEAIETINRPSRPDLVEVFWNDWGDRDDPDDHDSEIVPINKKACIKRRLYQTFSKLIQPKSNIIPL